MLPKEPKDLRDLFIEAEHFGLPELRNRSFGRDQIFLLTTVSFLFLGLGVCISRCHERFNGTDVVFPVQIIDDYRALRLVSRNPTQMWLERKEQELKPSSLIHIRMISNMDTCSGYHSVLEVCNNPTCSRSIIDHVESESQLHLLVI